MNAPTVTALGTAIVALISAIFAIFKWQTERAQWQKTFASERQKGVSDWQVQFLHDLVTRRVEAYPAVLRTLAVVRDVEGDEDHLAAVGDHPERLLETADQLLEHLYGEAGLVMSMGTRNRLHAARMACLKFQKGAASLDDLVYVFFYARRELRKDIQIADSESFATALSEIGAERLEQPKSAGVAGLRHDQHR
jgi:hypothetical protein